MRIRAALMVLFMAVTGGIGCQERMHQEKEQARPCPECPYADAPYPQKCQKCGFEWCSSSIGGSQSPSDSCPNCPLDICPETGYLIIQLGSLNELVRHQPSNAEYRRKQAECESKLKAHCESCKKCRDSLQ